MRRFLITIVVLLTAFFLYRLGGRKEASFRHNAAQTRVKACLENPTIDLAVMFPKDEKIFQQMSLGVDMAIAEANNRLNQDGSTGLQVEDSNHNIITKPLRCRYYTYDTKEEALELARQVSRQYSLTAVMGHYVSDISYPASLFYNEAGLLYFCMFATSTRITSHNWPNTIRVLPSVKGYVAAILENLNYLFDKKQEAIRIAVFRSDSIYGEDAITALHRQIAENKRLVSILRKTEKMIEDTTLSPDEPINEWLSINMSDRESMMDKLDVSDKMFITQKLERFGIAPGVRLEDLDIHRLQDSSLQLFKHDMPVSVVIDSLHAYTPDVEVVFSARYRHGTTEFGHYLRTLSKSDADIILLLDYLNETSEELIRELRETGITLPIIGDDGLELPDRVKAVLGDKAGDIYLVNIYDGQTHGIYLTWKFEELSDYFPDMDEEFKPNYMTFQGYKAASLLTQAITKCRSLDPFIIASRIKHTSDIGWENLGGNFLLFNSHGDITNPIFLLKKYHDGQFKLYQKEEE